MNMDLRWLQRADGSKVLQTMPVILDRHGDPIETDEWYDVPTVEEPKRAREFLIGLGENLIWKCEEWFGQGTIPPRYKIYREVLE